MAVPADPMLVDGPPPFEPEPVIEAYKSGIDRSLIRENLKRTPDERMRALAALQRFAAELRRAGRIAELEAIREERSKLGS